MKNYMIIAAALLCWSHLCAPPAHGDTLDAEEAVTVARWWLEQEISDELSPLPPEEQQRRLALLAQPSAEVLWQDGDAFRSGVNPGEWTTAAYLVTFPEGGFVVVSGDDRITPVLAFDAHSPFKWEGRQKRAGRVLLSRILASWYKVLAKDEAGAKALGVNAEWIALRAARASAGGSYGGPNSRSVNIELTTASWDQDGFYNAGLLTHAPRFMQPSAHGSAGKRRVGLAPWSVSIAAPVKALHTL